MEGCNHNSLDNLDVYRLSRSISKIAWSVYRKMNWQDKKIIGDQFIRAVDSVGANVAEGYGRYHYLDKIKFYYNARGSLLEGCKHWLGLLEERNKIDDNDIQQIKIIFNELSPKLNAFIQTTYKQRYNKGS